MNRRSLFKQLARVGAALAVAPAALAMAADAKTVEAAPAPIEPENLKLAEQMREEYEDGLMTYEQFYARSMLDDRTHRLADDYATWLKADAELVPLPNVFNGYVSTPPVSWRDGRISMADLYGEPDYALEINNQGRAAHPLGEGVFSIVEVLAGNSQVAR
jgi:hypothetical protein